MIRIVVFAFAMFISGCAVFEAGDLPKTTLADSSGFSGPKPTLSYSLEAMTGGMSSNKASSKSARKEIDEDVLIVLEESSRFGRISTEANASDIHLDLVLTGDSNEAAIIPAFVTGFSFYTIPSWVTIKYELVATAKRADGLERKYVVSDSYKLVQWLPMAVVFPFKSLAVINDLRKNMVARVISDMEVDGFFSGAGRIAEN